MQVMFPAALPPDVRKGCAFPEVAPNACGYAAGLPDLQESAA
jgi:hypothetical protein